jgi:hypothetical protein
VTPCLSVSLSQHHVETCGNIKPTTPRHIQQNLSTQAERIIGEVERMADEMPYEVGSRTDEVENISDEV